MPTWGPGGLETRSYLGKAGPYLPHHSLAVSPRTSPFISLSLHFHPFKMSRMILHARGDRRIPWDAISADRARTTVRPGGPLAWNSPHLALCSADAGQCMFLVFKDKTAKGGWSNSWGLAWGPCVVYGVGVGLGGLKAQQQEENGSRESAQEDLSRPGPSTQDPSRHIISLPL